MRLLDMDIPLPKLESAIHQLWDTFPPSLLQNLARSVPRMLQKYNQRKENTNRLLIREGKC